MTTDHSNLIPVSYETNAADAVAWGAVYDNGRTSFAKFLKVLADQQNPRNIDVERYDNEARTVRGFVVTTWTPARFVVEDDHRGDVEVGLVVRFGSDGSFTSARYLSVRKTTDGTPVLAEGYGKIEKASQIIGWAKSRGVKAIERNLAAAAESARLAAAKRDARETATKFFFEDGEVASVVRNIRAEGHRNREDAIRNLESVIARSQAAIDTLKAHPDYAYANNLHLESIGRDVVEATQAVAALTTTARVLRGLGVESPVVPFSESEIWAAAR
jgi:hypothetical protein